MISYQDFKRIIELKIEVLESEKLSSTLIESLYKLFTELHQNEVDKALKHLSINFNRKKRVRH